MKLLEIESCYQCTFKHAHTCLCELIQKKVPVSGFHPNCPLPQSESIKRMSEDARMWERRYNEQTKLAASYFTNPVDKECICEWPDKTLRKVMVTSLDQGTAHIIWNERHDPIEGQGVVVGMDDTVPVDWLYIPARKMEDSK